MVREELDSCIIDCEKCIIKIDTGKMLLNVQLKLDSSPCTDLFYCIIKHLILTKSDSRKFSSSNVFQIHGICSIGIYEALGDTQMNEAVLVCVRGHRQKEQHV